MQDKELVARADERLAHAYEQIARADEQLARLNQHMSERENDGARKKKSPPPPRGRPALRGFVGLLLTAGIFTAAYAWHSHGETARPIIARWVPQLAAPSQVLQTPKLAADPAPRAVQIAAADAAISQLPAPAQSALQDAASSPVLPETTQLMQTMARDLANLRQEIEELKAGQEALTRDNARNAEQLRETQEQTARAIAAVSEQNQRRTSAAPPLPVANPARKQVSAVAPSGARAQAAQPPVRLQPRQQ
jgi:hypothetical protein